MGAPIYVMAGVAHKYGPDYNYKLLIWAMSNLALIF